MTNLVGVYVPRKTWISSWMTGGMVEQASSCKANACWLAQWSWATCSNKNAPNPCCNFISCNICALTCCLGHAIHLTQAWMRVCAAELDHELNPNEEWHDLESFKEAIVRVWDSVTSDTQYMQSLYQSMVRRLQHCIANGGDIVDWTAYKGWPWCHCNHTYDYEHMSLQHVVDIVTHVHTCNTTCMYELHMHHAVCNERVVMCLVHPMQTSNTMLLFNACQQGSEWMQLEKTTNVVLSTYRCKP